MDNVATITIMAGTRFRAVLPDGTLSAQYSLTQSMPVEYEETRDATIVYRTQDGIILYLERP